MVLAAVAIGGAACERGEPASPSASRWPEQPGLTLPDDWDAAHPTLSPNARPDVHLAALAERAAGRSEVDTAGRVWLDRVVPVSTPDELPRAQAPETPPREGKSGRPTLPASSRARFDLIFEAGPAGVVEGGSLFVLPDPFWFWSEAQTRDPAAPGYTTAQRVDATDESSSAAAAAAAAADDDDDDDDSAAAAADAEALRLVPGEVPGSFRVEGRALVAGERVRIVYGAGAAGAQVDRYAESGSAIRIGLDADADGRRAWLAPTAAVDVVAAEPEQLVAFGPAEVRPGERFTLSLALVDASGNHAPWPSARPAAGAAPRLEVGIASRRGVRSAPVEGLGRRALDADGHGPVQLTLVAPPDDGTLRLRVRGEGALAGFEAEVPPIVVREAPTRLVWADLHGHSAYSDGSGTPDDYFRYARDVARLDAVALTDHDHWGIEALDESPERREEILSVARAWHAPGRFVTLPGYEWTSWLHGHRHVLSFEDALPFFSSLDYATDRPDELWAALRGRPVLTFAHHSAGDPVATNWNFAPDPALEPVTEIASVHGMSEALDAPAPIGGAVAGNFVRDVLLYGAKLGFIGSGDSHDGHPGLAALAAGQAGLAGIHVRSLDREALREALRRRRVFATNGIRPWLDVSIDDVAMGGTLDPTATERPDQLLRVRYEATAPIERIELVRTGRIAQVDRAEAGAPDEGSFDRVELERRIPRLEPGEFHYVRIVQRDGGVAWSSPIFAERDASDPNDDGDANDSNDESDAHDAVDARDATDARNARDAQDARGAYGESRDRE